MVRTISDKEYEDALANESNRKVMHKAGNKFASLLTEEQLHTCSLYALWRALQNHDSSYGQRFTTTLWRFMHWECGKEVRRPKMRVGLPRPKTVVSEEIIYVNELIDFLEPSQQRLIREYYLEGLSAREIGLRHGCCRETARKRVNKAMAALRERCSLKQNQGENYV